MPKSKMREPRIFMVLSKNDVETKSFVSNTIKKIFGDDYHSYNLSLDDIEHIENALVMRSLLNENKVVFISYTSKDLAKKYVITKPKKKTLTYEEKLLSVLKSLTNNVLVFLLPDFSDKRKSLQKYVAEHFDYIEIPEPEEAYLKKLIKNHVKQNNATISKEAITYILQSVDRDVNLILSELDKILLYTNDITLDLAKEFIVVSSNVVVFDIIDAVAKKDVKKTIMLLDGYIGSSNDNIFSLIALLQRSFVFIYYATIYKADFAKKLKLNNFIADKYLEKSKLFSRRELVKKMNLLVKTECELKSGLIPDNVFYDLMLSLVK